MALASHKRYPTAWQRKMMWAALSAVFIVVLVGIVGSVLWIATRLMAFLQPILIPVAIAIILAYLLDPVVTHLAERRMSRTKAISLLFAIAFLGLVALVGWIVPTISIQSTAFMRDLPGYTVKARDQVVDWIYRYNLAFGPAITEKPKTSVAKTFVDWLLASPPPISQPRPSPPPGAEDIPELIERGSGEIISPASPKLTSAERQRIQEWVERMLPNLQSQLPLLMEKFWGLLKTSIGGFLG
ncbi:MAG TPA: AI-2E family transporter, partial [Chthoniobacterales bacterium]